MEIHQIILMSLLLTHSSSKKYVSSSDEESIENLLYYRDCQHDKESTTSQPTKLKLSETIKPRAPECAFPKMCCALTCGDNECAGSSSFMSRQNQMDPLRMETNFPPIGHSGPFGKDDSQTPMQLQDPPQPMRGRKRKEKPHMKPMQPPIGSRRDFGFTKDKIKSLINHDDDIRKILKDLVKVTMQKVNLVEMISSKKPATTPPSETWTNSDDGGDEEVYDDDEEVLE